MSEGTDPQRYRTRLRDLLVERFSEDDLRTLCFDLGVDYDSLGGEGKAGKARELLIHLDHHGNISELIEKGQQLRPDIGWDALFDDRPTPDNQGRVRVVGQRPQDVVDYFKDREEEIATISRSLADPVTRLVSIIGQGGMGKTALACKVLGELERGHWPHTDGDAAASEPPDGIIYLSARTAGISLERLFLDCAKLLGGEQQKRLNGIWTSEQLGTGEKVFHLLETLRAGQYVILLDNLDDLLDDGGQIVDEDMRLFLEQCLIASRGVRLLLTSRIALALRREAMRFGRQVNLLKGLPAADAAELLRELDPNSDYGLRDASDTQLAGAVSMTHGVPRALEVLIGILANDPLAYLDETVNQFYDQEDVVTALVEENYKRLDRGARQVIEALAVFRRPVQPEAIAYLLAPFSPQVDVPSIIRRLVRTNIAAADRGAKTVTLHPIDQDYAYSQLPESSIDKSGYTRQALERRAADYYVQLRTPPETWESIDDLEPQLTEFEHRVCAQDYNGACLVLNTIDIDYLQRWGHYARERMLRTQLVGHLTDLRLHMVNLGRLGPLYQAQGQFKQAAQTLEDALAIARRIDDQGSECMYLWQLGLTHISLRNFDQAIKVLEVALGIAFNIGDRQIESRCFRYLGISYRGLRDLDRAIKYQKRALAVAREISYYEGEESALSNLGFYCTILGDYNQAIDLLEESLSLHYKYGNLRGEAIRLSNLGLAYHALGGFERAIELFEQAFSINRNLDMPSTEAIRLAYLGRVHYSLGQFGHAIRLIEDAVSLSKTLDIPQWRTSRYLSGLGKALLANRELDKAQQNLQEAVLLDKEENNCEAVLMLAIALLHQRDSGSAGAFTDAIACCQPMVDTIANLDRPRSRYLLAAALVGQAACTSCGLGESVPPESLGPALREYRRALDSCSAKGIVQDAIRDLELIRAAGIEGLEPVFELLEGAMKDEA